MKPGRFVNKLLEPAGLKLQRLPPKNDRTPERKVPWWRHIAAIQELHDYLIASQFPGLPGVEGRIERLAALEGVTIIQAMWIVNALHHSLMVEGDICEFGVAAGATSALMANELLSTNKSLWLFDSFEGLSKPGQHDELLNDVLELGSMEAYTGKMAFPEALVRNKLAQVSFPEARTHLRAGYIDKTLQSGPLPQKVCFAFVDFDFYDPIQIALNFLVVQMPPGGVIVVDDYDYFSTGAKKAVDEFTQAQSGRFQLDIAPAWAGHFAILRKLQ